MSCLPSIKTKSGRASWLLSTYAFDLSAIGGSTKQQSPRTDFWAPGADEAAPGHNLLEGFHSVGLQLLRKEAAFLQLCLLCGRIHLQVCTQLLPQRAQTHQQGPWLATSALGTGATMLFHHTKANSTDKLQQCSFLHGGGGTSSFIASQTPLTSEAHTEATL